MSSFVLKLIAAVTMLIDHAGLILFPEAQIMRVIGRLAFPIYAYCIAEGFRYTKNRLHYFLRIFVLGFLCQIVYTIVDRQIYLGILITFSISLIIMAALESARKARDGEVSDIAAVFEKITRKPLAHRADYIVNIAAVVLLFAASFFLCIYVEVDYGFFGILLPVFTSLFKDKQQRLIMFSITLLALWQENILNFQIISRGP